MNAGTTRPAHPNKEAAPGRQPGTATNEGLRMTDSIPDPGQLIVAEIRIADELNRARDVLVQRRAAR